MLAHCDFREQAATRDGDGALLVPDLVVNLPGGKHVVVDAKAPLAGATERRLVELVACTAKGKMSWLWLNPWVTEDSRIRVPRLMDPAFGVWTVNDCL